MKKMTLENSEFYTWGDNCKGWHMLKRDDVSVIREMMPPGAAEQMHFHDKSRQFFFILVGTATFKLGRNEVVLHPHEGLEIPPKVTHQIRNEGVVPLEFMLFSCPTTRGDRVNLDSE